MTQHARENRTSALTASVAERRGFIGRMLAGAIGLMAAASAGAPQPLEAAVARRDDDDWMSALTGKHRTVFDLGGHKNGKPLAQSKNYLDAWRDAFHVPESEVNLVIGVHGDAVPMVLGDALWARYRLGEQYDVKDAATKAPATRNVFTAAHLVPNGPVTAEQTIEALQKRGVRFTVCMNAIGAVAKTLSSAGFGAAPEIRAALLGDLLPGVITVPAMVVALTQLQERGVKYTKLG